MTLLLDYAWARPTPAAIKAAGYSGVMRYLSNDPTKNLSFTERDKLLEAGLSIGLVWETTAARAGQGWTAGVEDRRTAEAQAKALGMPAHCPIFYAVDYDATPAAVAPYFAGISAVASHPVGVYGSYRICEAATAPYRWQTSAWSAGKVLNRAHLYQRLHATVPYPISGTDENQLMRAFPLWTTNTPAPAPATTTVPTQEQTMADLVLLNPATKADASAASGLSSIWAYTFLNYKMLVALGDAAGVDTVDEAAIAASVVAGLSGPLKDAVTAAVTAGGSVDQITDAVLARISTALTGA